MMEIRPILSALMRSKVSMILIGLQVALTLAIVCNALFIISQRMDLMGQPTGMNEADTFSVSSYGFGAGFNVQSSVLSDLTVLRALPGVVDATSVNTVPLSNSGWNSSVSTQLGDHSPSTSAAFYFGDDHAVDTYAVNLVAGRNFMPEEIGFRTMDDVGTPAVVIITQALGEQLFPGESAIGRQFYFGGDETSAPTTVVGVVERLQAPWPNFAHADNSLMVPQRLSSGNSSSYLIRAAPGRRDELMKQVEDVLVKADSNRIVRSLKSMQARRAEVYAGDRAMAIILAAVIVALLGITALGIVGMASFWVAQRTRQIGTRRALGATRLDILRYFLTENLIITTIGLVVGSVLAYGLSLWLMTSYQSPRLPWYYVPIGCVCLWLLGQIAVLGPAVRASRVSPAVATRSV